MIVKLKCVDNCGIEYLTTGKVYETVKLYNYNNVYDLHCDSGEIISVSTNNRDNNFHGKWEVVNE